MKRLVIVALLLIAACSQQPVCGPDEQIIDGECAPESPDAELVYTGPVGFAVDVSFQEGFPPENVGDEPFTVIVDVKNTGENPIPVEDTLLSIAGLDPRMFGLSGIQELRREITEPLQPGETVAFTFEGLQLSQDYVPESTIEFSATFCYTYDYRKQQHCKVTEQLLTLTTA